MWRAWASMGGLQHEVEGFDSYFQRSVKAMKVALASFSSRSSLGGCADQVFQVASSPQRLYSYKKACSQNHGVSPSHVFPLAPMSFEGSLIPLRSGPLEWLCLGGNMVVAALNWMHGGPTDAVSATLSAAHERSHARIARGLQDMVMTDDPILSKGALDQFLRQSQHYRGGGAVLALGVKGGVPDRAADVPLSDHLSSLFPAMAEQVREPRALLLSSRKRPRRVKRGYTWLAASYPKLVLKNVEAGLHRLKKPSQVARHRGAMVLAGAFAVAKDDKEDRVITDPSVNQLLNPEKLPRPKFAFIPSLRVLTVPRTGIITVSKRDARHYFHRLRIGKKWHRWLCGPGIHVGREAKVFHPACQAAPMGFGPSAGWAQGLTDVATTDAELPMSCRIRPDFVVPEGLPVWGSIIDDLWALDHVDDIDGVAVTGPEWLNRAEEAWELRGVESHKKKSVDGARGEEIQGYYVHPFGHWVGLSLEKRRYLYQATMQVLMQRDVHIGVVEWLIGKHGFAHSSRPCLRSIFSYTYQWLQEVRSQRHERKRVVLPLTVWHELAASALLLPFAQFDVSSPWSQRVEATDASLTGIGRSFAVMPEAVVKALARYSAAKGVYTNVSLPWGVNLSEEHTCPIRKVRLPKERVKWKHLGCPWSPKHITLGEADAAVWAASDRLRRSSDDGKRFVHPLDSVAVTGAFTKGRSSSYALNDRCRQMCAINICGGHDVFYPWIPSADNPADEPSRWYEQPGDQTELSLQEPGSSEPVVDLRCLGCFPKDAYYFIHLCSGPRRNGDLLDSVERACSQVGIDVVGIAIDPLATVFSSDGSFSPIKGDLLAPFWGRYVLDLIHSRRVLGGFGSPPCSTISAARHRPLAGGGGPRPLRSRDAPWEPLPYCTTREVLAVQTGSLLFLLCVGILGEICYFGGWVGLEHPADGGKPPFESFFNTEEMALFKVCCRLRYYVVDQCMYGTPSKKPTGLVLPEGSATMVRRCHHDRKHEMLLGRLADGSFKTTAAARYPADLCFELARVFADRCLKCREKGFIFPFRPKSSDDLSLAEVDPWGLGIHVAWRWPRPRPNFLTELVETINHSKIHCSARTTQQ